MKQFTTAKSSQDTQSAQPGTAQTDQATQSAQPPQTAENEEVTQPGAGGTAFSDSGAGSAAPWQLLNVTSTALLSASSQSPAGMSRGQTEVAGK